MILNLYVLHSYYLLFLINRMNLIFKFFIILDIWLHHNIIIIITPILIFYYIINQKYLNFIQQYLKKFNLPKYC